MLCLLMTGLGVGVSYINISNNQTTYQGIVTNSKDNYFILNSKLESLYVYSENNNYEIGDILAISGYKKELSFTTIESQFDFKDYLNKKGVYFELVSEKIEIKFYNPIRLRAFRNYTLNKYNDETKSLLNAVLFNEREDDELTDTISSLHLQRLISSSGIYLYLFYSVFTFLFALKLKDKWAKLLGLGVMSFYLLFTFPKFSCLRFFFFILFKWINGYILKKKYSYYTVLGFTGLFFLTFNYHLAYQDSFYLGFIIPLIYRFINNFLSEKKKRTKMFLPSILILIFFIPYELSYYYELSPLSYIFQFLLFPLMLPFAFLGLLSFYGLPIYRVVELFAFGIKRVALWLSKGLITLHAPALAPLLLFVFNALYFISLYYLSIGFKPIYKVSFTLMFTFLLMYILPIKNAFTNSVSFINVGQGDACLIRKQNTTILIDTGGSTYIDIAKDCLIPYFKKNRIYDIDLVITTHDDYDHSGAFNSLTNNFVVKNVINDKNSFPIDIDGIKFTNYNNYFSYSSEENEQSLVIGFHLANHDFLITGDAPTEIENKIMSDYSYIPCDILKVGHHGSKTSTSDKFIKFLSPKEAIISVGKNYYGHPNKEVINILKKNNVLIHQTNIEGTITYQSFCFS